MKKTLSFLLVWILIFSARAQNIGIGTVTPSEKLHVSDGHIKVGTAVLGTGQSNLIKFGDGDFVTVGEAGSDDQLTFTGSYYIFRNNGGFGGRVGINVSSGVPAAQLDVIGNVKITDGSEGDGKVFVSNSTGLGSWSGSYAFAAHMLGNQNIAGLTTANNLYLVTDYNPGGGYFNGISSYTVPVNGIYHIDVAVTVASSVANQPVKLRLQRNGVAVREQQMNIPTAGTNASIPLSADLQLTAGDLITVVFVNNSFGSVTVLANGGSTEMLSYFNAHLAR